MIEKWMIYKLGHSAEGCFWPQNSLYQNGRLVDLPFFNQFLIFLQKWSRSTTDHLLLSVSYEIQKFSKTLITLILFLHIHKTSLFCYCLHLYTPRAENQLKKFHSNITICDGLEIWIFSGYFIFQAGKKI